MGMIIEEPSEQRLKQMRSDWGLSFSECRKRYFRTEILSALHQEGANVRELLVDMFEEGLI